MKIPKKAKETAQVLGAGAVLATIVILAWGKKKNRSGVVKAGGVYYATAGEKFVLHLPPGQYQMLGGDDLTIVSETIIGGRMNVVLLPRYLPNPYTIRPVFVDKFNSNRQFNIHVHVTPGTPS